MKIRSLTYFADEAVRNTMRNSIMSITSIITVSACVLMLVLLYCIGVNVDNALSQLESTTGVLTIFIDDSATNDDVMTLYNEIWAIEHVSLVEFVPAEQAMDDFKATLSEDAAKFLEGLDGVNVLRRRFTVTLESGKYDELVIAQLERIKSQSSVISSYNHFKDISDKLTAISNVVRIVCVFIILILFFLAVVIIINTIKLAVNSRKIEISIMKYVGATDWFIRWPFIFEGVFIGAMGSIIPLVLLVLGYDYATGKISGGLFGIGIQAQMLPGIEIFKVLIPVSIIFGCIIGIAGSIFSVRKYLRV